MFYLRGKDSIKSTEQNEINWGWFQECSNLDSKSKKSLDNFYKEFRRKLEKEADKCRNKNGEQTGDRNFVVEIFKKSLIKLFEETNEKLKDGATILKEEPLDLKEEWNELHKKRIDLQLGSVSGKRIFIEIKTAFDIDKLGSCLVESLITNKKEGDKFYILCLFTGQNDEHYKNCKKMVKSFEKDINGLISFLPKYDIKDDVIQFLDEVKNFKVG